MLSFTESKLESWPKKIMLTLESYRYQGLLVCLFTVAFLCVLPRHHLEG